MFCEEQGIWINEKSLSHATGFLLYYRGSYPASRANDLSSFTPDPSVVSMSPINSPFTPADSACFCVSLDNLARPPANRMNVRGSMNLKIAIVTKISSSLMVFPVWDSIYSWEQNRPLILLVQKPIRYVVSYFLPYR